MNSLGCTTRTVSVTSKSPSPHFSALHKSRTVQAVTPTTHNGLFPVVQIMFELISSDTGDYAAVWSGAKDWTTLEPLSPSHCAPPSSDVLTADHKPQGFHGSSARDPLGLAHHAVLSSAVLLLMERLYVILITASSSL